jgi:glycogen debranching enzyme
MSTKLNRDQLRAQAVATLAANDLGGWTRPAPGVYPHQWLWDSCFIAIGLARADPHRAAAELRSLARGQWRGGMMPHMIYARQFPYWLEALLWDTGNFVVHRGVRTSGLTQPPMYTIAAEAVAQALPGAERAGFIREILPVALRFHDWIYRERDPAGTGLAVCLHSWECGLDDTPYWTEPMNTLPRLPWYWRWLREFRRVNPEERTTITDLQHMLFLARLMKSQHYQSAPTMKHSPVVIQDLVFNAVLAAANESLERLAESIGQEVPAPLRDRFAPTRRALEHLWDDHTSAYYSRDYHSGHLIREPTVATFMPLFAGTATPARARHLRDALRGPGFATEFPVPSVPTTSRLFEPQRYWRGPVWISPNWFIIKGLRRYGFTAEADALRDRTLAMVARAGFREYFDPTTGAGLGAHDFSWSASLTLDLL